MRDVLDPGPALHFSVAGAVRAIAIPVELPAAALALAAPRGGIAAFQNDIGSIAIAIGVTGFTCIGASPPSDHPHVWLDMGQAGEIRCPYCATLFTHDPALAFGGTRPAGCFHDPANPAPPHDYSARTPRAAGSGRPAQAEGPET
ncbi:MAG: zinc-finger protein [Alphaproteobacteria bacterium]|nr:zinc-finger protein [Alphaproteobacteria bacterium]